VVDCAVNDWVKEIAARTGIIKKEMETVEEEKQYSPEEKALIIAQLKMMGTSTGDAMAAQMEATIK
jgi:hypothetical protein